MDELTAGQLLGVAPYTIRDITLDPERDVWLVTVRDMSSHTNTVRELPAERVLATGGVVTELPSIVGESGPEDMAASADVAIVALPVPKPPRKSKAKP